MLKSEERVCVKNVIHFVITLNNVTLKHFTADTKVNVKHINRSIWDISNSSNTSGWLYLRAAGTDVIGAAPRQQNMAGEYSRKDNISRHNEQHNTPHITWQKGQHNTSHGRTDNTQHISWQNGQHNTQHITWQNEHNASYITGQKGQHITSHGRTDNTQHISWQNGQYNTQHITWQNEHNTSYIMWQKGQHNTSRGRTDNTQRI